VADEVLLPQGPPFDSQWPPEVPGGRTPRRKVPRWSKWVAGIAAVLLAVGVAGSVIRVPYDTLSPGGALNLETRISIHGTKSYRGHGAVMLLFVRERTHVDLWRWLQAKLDPNIDLVKQQDVTGGNTQQEANLQDVCDMSQSQTSAEVAALTALGYKVPVLPGLEVANLLAGFPAVKVLRPCDEIVAADGHELKQPGELSQIVRAHRVGTTVALRIVRAGRTMTEHVPVTTSPTPQKTPVIGVELALRYKIPVKINIDTSDVSGPSAGLAMALAIIDTLTPGDLTGGKNVAVTGTIDAAGHVGEIGGLPQKAVAARAAGAQLFLVPVCADDGNKSACLADLESAKKRVGKNVVLAPVSTLAQALKALRDAGGAPVRTGPTT
jgi:Lon-like protease